MQFPLQQRDLHQARIVQAKQRRTQRPRQRQVVLRRHQHIKQRHQIKHFAAVDQIGFFANLGGDVQRPQFLLQWQQAGPLARQHHHLFGRQSGGNLPGNPRGGLTRFERAQGFLKQFARRRQAVAPSVGLRRIALGWPASEPGNRGQAPGFALPGRVGGVVPKAVVAVCCAGLSHDGVDRGHHVLRIAAGVVATEQIAAQPFHHKGLRGAKHLRLGAAKAVNALFRVTNQKHAGRGTRAAIATQPR